MELQCQTTLSLTVLLLAFAFVGNSASPVPFSLLSRIRKSAAGTTADIPTNPTGGATPGTSTTQAPVSRESTAASRAPSTSVDLGVHFVHLRARVESVTREHRRLYSDYKKERFAYDSDPVVRDMGLSYVPSSHTLPNRYVRRRLPDSELVSLHYINLIVFKDTLTRVRDSETTNVTNRVDEVIVELHLVIERLERTMIIFGQEASIIRVESTIPPFHTDVTPQERNMRTLYVLQEFHYYMSDVKHDYRVLANRHEQ